MAVFVQTFIALAVLCLTLLYVYLRRNFNYWKNRNIPYAKPNILFGNLTFVMRKSIWKYFLELRQKYPNNDYVGIFLGLRPTLVVQTPELARKVLVKDFDNFHNRMCCSSYETDPLGALNLFTVRNPTWSKLRHELSPMFTALRLKYVTELMNVNAKELVLKIKRDHIDRNEPVNLKELFSMYTSDTVGSTVFGIKVSALNDPSSPLWFITKNMVKWTFWRGFEFTMFFFVPTVAALMKLQLFSQGATDYVKKLFWTIVEERKSGDNTKYKDLINHLLKLRENLKLPGEAGTQLADDYMMAQVAVFILGSIETSSTTLSYCLYELAHHQEEQEKLYEEISEAKKNTGKDVLEYDDLCDLKYLTACILETLRKHVPVPYLDRISNSKYELDDGVIVEKDTPVFINVMALHYDEILFPEPQKWKPERMEGVQETDNLQFSLLPFGDGPRFCIGKRYGVMQVRAALAHIVLSYKIEPEPTEMYPMKPDPYSVFLAPISGCKVKFVPR